MERLAGWRGVADRVLRAASKDADLRRRIGDALCGEVPATRMLRPAWALRVLMA